MVSSRLACFVTFLFFYFNPAVTVSAAVLPHLLFELIYFKLPVLLKKILLDTTQVFGRFLENDAVANSSDFDQAVINLEGNFQSPSTELWICSFNCIFYNSFSVSQFFLMDVLKEKPLGKKLAQILKPLDMIAPKVLPFREISSPDLIQLAKRPTSFYVLTIAYKTHSYSNEEKPLSFKELSILKQWTSFLSFFAAQDT